MNFFSPDSKGMTLLNRAVDVFFVNLLALLCSVPVITAGAAMTAQYYVCMKVVSGKEVQVSRDFFRSFRENFRQSTRIWLVCLVIIVLLGVDLLYVSGAGASMTGRVVQVLLIVIAVIFGMVVLFGFPLLARFELSFREWGRVTLYVVFSHIPTGLLAAALSVIPVALSLKYPQWFAAALFIPIVTTYFLAWRCDKIFEGMLSDEAKAEQERKAHETEDLDPWLHPELTEGQSDADGNGPAAITGSPAPRQASAKDGGEEGRIAFDEADYEERMQDPAFAEEARKMAAKNAMWGDPHDRV